MKRRVVRAHANKRNLRLISATHALLPGSYNVLCDASFLRAALLSYAQQHLPKLQGKHKAQKPSQSDTTEQEGASGKPSPMQFLRSIVEEAFGALESTAGGEEAEEEKEQHKRHMNRRMQYRGMGPQAVAAAQKRKLNKPKPLQIRYSCLPSTVTTLRRLIDQHNEAMAHYKPSYYTPHVSHKQVVRKLVPETVVDALLGSIRVIRGIPDRSSALLQQDAKANTPAVNEYERNEVKAISDFMAYCASRRQAKDAKNAQSPQEAVTKVCKALPDNVPNAFHFFIATQSHDVRKHLPSKTALLRWATLPDCVYIELLDTTYHYSAAGKAATRQATTDARSNKSTRQEQLFSKADLAFMQSIGKLPPTLQRKINATQQARQPNKTTASLTTSNRAIEQSVPLKERDVSSSTMESNTAAAKTTMSKAKKRHRTHQPNPLSMKKKQKREVFRIS